MMRQQGLIGSVLMLVGGVFAAGAVAQTSEPAPASRGARASVSEAIQVSGGFDVAYAMATGELARSFDHGWGGGAHLSLSRGRAPLGLAVEGWLAEYGSETSRRRLFPDTERVLVDVDTSNWIAHLSAGPELARRTGRVRPYAKALAGFTYFSTSTSVEGSSDAEPFATTTHHDDWNLSGVLAAGVRLAVTRSERVALDVGARYVWNGEASYLVEGDLRESSDGRLLFDPRRTQANAVVFTVGLAFGR